MTQTLGPSGSSPSTAPVCPVAGNKTKILIKISQRMMTVEWSLYGRRGNKRKKGKEMINECRGRRMGVNEGEDLDDNNDQ